MALKPAGPIAFTTCLLLACILYAETPLSPSEQRGRLIYTKGNAGGEAITAQLGESAAPVPATLLPCVNCHGGHGRGLPEGGVIPADITWHTLTKPYNLRTSNGRERPPYDETKLKRAISMGIDSGGTPLDRAMPRYRMSHDQMADLLTWLKRLDNTSEPGLSETSVLIAMMPPNGPAGEEMVKTVHAFIDWENKQGGIYNRQLQLEVISPTNDRVASLKSAIAGHEPFALLACDFYGSEAGLAELVQRYAIPVIGAITPRPVSGFPLNRQVFYLEAGGREQALGMITYAVAKHPSNSMAVVYQPETAAWAEAVQNHCRKINVHPPSLFSLTSGAFAAAGLARKLADEKVEVVLCLGLDSKESELAFLRSAEKAGWHPLFMLPQAVNKGGVYEAPKPFSNRILLGLPTTPQDRTYTAETNYKTLVEAYNLPRSPSGGQLKVLTAATLLMEGMLRTGRELTRKGLIDALESLYDYETGYSAPLSYNPNRRIGAAGAYITAVDLDRQRLITLSGFIEPHRGVEGVNAPREPAR